MCVCFTVVFVSRCIEQCVSLLIGCEVCATDFDGLSLCTLLLIRIHHIGKIPRLTILITETNTHKEKERRRNERKKSKEEREKYTKHKTKEMWSCVLFDLLFCFLFELLNGSLIDLTGQQQHLTADRGFTWTNERKERKG